MTRPPLAVVICAFGAVFLGCGEFPRTGSIVLLVTAPSDAKVQQVDYEITGERLHEVDGTITTAEPSSTFSRFVSHVPVGKGYIVKLEAKSKDGKTSCNGTASADVKVSATTLVQVTSTCQSDNQGHISIVVGVGVQCPGFAVTSYTVSPLSASIGGMITVAATTTDSDGGSPSFLWTAPSGTFAMPTEPRTTYTCAVPGPVTLTASAFDGPCRDSKAVSVSCVSDGGADQ